MRETAGWTAALAIALITTAQVAASARAELLFRDGDSVIVTLFSRALQAGDPLDWAMSSVLFLPETALFTLLDAVAPFGVDGVLALNAVANLLALYGALRLAAGRRMPGRAPVSRALAAFAVFALLAMTGTSSSRDALELASLLLTTTYYSATVVAVVLTVGLIRRSLDGARPLPLLLVMTAVAAVSTLSNPLFAVWATVPLTAVLGVLALRGDRRGRTLGLGGALLLGSVAGVVLRIPFGAWIANTGVGYARPEEWAASLRYYSGLLGDRLAHPLGLLGASIVVALLVLAVARTVRAETTASRLVAAAAWVMPVLVVIGAVALGTHAARYLQPLAFAPVLAVVARPGVLELPRVITRTLAGLTAVALAIGATVSVSRLVAAASAPDPDLTCVTDWVTAAGRPGAGQFWTVRLPKLHLDDPALLVQVDHRLQGYAWLVNRADFSAGAVSYLVEDAQTVPWELPVAAIPEQIVDCGRYRILDFGDAELPLGPQRS